MANGVAPESVIPIEGTLLALAMLVASGRLVPRFLQRQCPTVSDSLLIASILDAIGLFVTDYLTYTWGGMSDDVPEPSVARVIALKKVQFAGNAFYDTGIYWPKLAILALYFRLIPPTMPWLRKALYAVTLFTDVLSMAEMAVAIMVVSLPSMRSFLRRGTLFSSNKKSRSSESRTYGHQTPASGSHNFLRPSRRGKHSVRVHTDEDSGSEVELNTMARKDVIYETHRVSVQFSKSQDEEHDSSAKYP
ncbi:unnamed protein product [Alternaria alternata]